MTKRLIIFGTSGHGRVVADVASMAGWEVVGWADESPEAHGRLVEGAPVVAGSVDETVEQARSLDAEAVVAIGNQTVRRRIYDALLSRDVAMATVVHPSATVATNATIGAGTVIVAGAVVNPGASIGANCIVNTLASVDHDCDLGDHVHISPGAHLGGTVVVGAGTHIGIGATVRNNTRIGAWSVIGAGAVVVADIPDSVVAYGVPARVMREVSA